MNFRSADKRSNAALSVKTCTVEPETIVNKNGIFGVCVAMFAVPNTLPIKDENKPFSGSNKGSEGLTGE
jgi:hypothetical protein